MELSEKIQMLRKKEPSLRVGFGRVRWGQQTGGLEMELGVSSRMG